MSKIVYITAKAPFGKGEEFILDEMLTLKKMGANLLIIPRDKSVKLFHKKAKSLIKDTLIIPWFNKNIAIKLLIFIIKNPIIFSEIIYDVVFKARIIKIGLKNLLIVPKSIYLSKILHKFSITHIHAHWASTTSTMAYIIFKITSIPWSFTAHRWDIPENNLLKIKCCSANFIRAINEQGRDEILEITKDKNLKKKIMVIHMGVDLPEIKEKYNKTNEIFTLICPARLSGKKGHKYLFKACKLLSDNGIKFKCLIAGTGPLNKELYTMVNTLKLSNCVKFTGYLAHEKLHDLYSSGKIHAVVLPSIITKDGAKEGIPVALMEAMSYCIPVISTDTGGIPELIGDGSGIIVREKDPEAIANAIVKLINDKRFYNKFAEKGREKVIKSFNITTVAEDLFNLFSIKRN